MVQRNKWSPRDERRAERARREEQVEFVAALVTAHPGDAADMLQRVSAELETLWPQVTTLQGQLEAAQEDRASWQKRARAAERALEVSQARVATLEVAEKRANKLQGDLGDAKREIAALQRAVDAAAPTHRAHPMDVDAAWIFIRQQPSLRLMSSQTRPDILRREDAGEVRRLCTLLSVADEGAARAAALEDLRAGLVKLRTRAARDSLSGVASGGVVGAQVLS
jgi:DNA repair exonuclease SbcCD ATPase subunit